MRLIQTVLLFTVTLLSGALPAVTLTVTNLNDSGAGSLRAAIAAATTTPPGDNIVFQGGLSGTITLVTELTANKPITITGPGGSPGITISGNNAVRCIDIFTGFTGITISISNLTLANGLGGNMSDFGGGMRISAAGVTLSLSNVTFQNCNSGPNGGGGGLALVFEAGTTLTNCIFTGNTAILGGGLFKQQPAPLAMTGCQFSGNSVTSNFSTQGGGMYVISAPVNMTGCTFSGNSASGSTGSWGGGLYSGGAGLVSITSCAFAQNSANQGGGAHFAFGLVVVADSTFNGNTAGNIGGGINLAHGSNSTTTFTLTNCTISGNTANGTGEGGGMSVAATSPAADLTVRLTNCTVANNTSANAANGVSMNARATTTGAICTVRYENSIISSAATPNFVASGTGTVNLVSDNNNICSDGTGNLTGANDKPNTNPLLGTLANNGGPTLTHMPIVNSPAIDGGRAIGGVTTDQRGVARPIDNAGVADASNGDGSDIGSVESPSTVSGDQEIDVERGGTQVPTAGTDNVGSRPAGAAASVTWDLFNIGATDPLTIATITAVPSGVANCAAVITSGTPSFLIGAGAQAALTINVTPTGLGAFQFTITISSDSIANSTYTITVQGTATGTAPNFTSAPAPAMAVDGVAYSHQFTASGNPAPTLALAAGSLPAWATLSSAGLLSGTPVLGQNGTFTVSAQNGVAPDDTEAVTITVVATGVAPTITSPAAPTTATVAASYTHTFSATGLPTPTFSATGLPAWLTFNPTSGLLSGTPAAGDVGTAGPITLTAANGVAPDATETFSIVVSGGSGSGGDGGGDEGGCSTRGSSGWLVLLTLAALTGVSIRRRRA